MTKVMLVEDDNNLREIYEARLLAEGYEIVSAKDGEEALAVAVKEKPDLISRSWRFFATNNFTGNTGHVFQCDLRFD